MNVVPSWHRSAALVVSHHLYEVVEQIVGVVRTGSSLGMVLDAEDRVPPVTEAFECVVVQVDVSHVDVARI
jgi:hypothetical protein